MSDIKEDAARGGDPAASEITIAPAKNSVLIPGRPRQAHLAPPLCPHERCFHFTDYQRLQHYRKRNPPWVKLYTNHLDDYRFLQLPDETKAHVMLLMLLASRMGNCMPWDEAWIASRIGAHKRVDLDRLRALGVIAEGPPPPRDPEIRTSTTDAEGLRSPDKSLAGC